MSACRDVKQWFTKEIQIPFETVITDAREECEQHKKKVEEEVRKPIESWVAKEERKCVEGNCDWWCLCCNKWFCWIFVLFVKMITWVFVMVIKWVPYVLCKVVTFVVDVLIEFIIKVVKFFVSFFVCLFTDIEGWLLNFADLWSDVTNLAEKVVDFAKSTIDDGIELTDDVIRLVESVSSSFGPVGTLIGGIIIGVLEMTKKIVDVTRDGISAAQEIVFGILGLNLCRLWSGLKNAGTTLGRSVLWPIGVIGGTFGGGPKRTFEIDDLRDIIRSALESEFGNDQGRIDRSIDRIGLYSKPFGLPMRIMPRRMVIRSSAWLKELHENGILNLYQLSGKPCDCSGELEESNLKYAQVVYTGTETTISYSDLNVFLSEGAEAVPSFSVYPIKKENFERQLRVGRDKAYRIGVEFTWDRIEDYELTREKAEMLTGQTGGTLSIAIPVAAQHHQELFANEPYQREGINQDGDGTNDDLGSIPAVAVFRHSGGRHGNTSWYRSSSFLTACNKAAATFKSGVSFIGRDPEYIFRYVLIHEIGHYLGLCHNNHDGIEHIMFTLAAGEGLDLIAGGTIPEYLLLGADPHFTSNDASEVWRWLTKVAKDSCLP